MATYQRVTRPMVCHPQEEAKPLNNLQALRSARSSSFLAQRRTKCLSTQTQSPKPQMHSKLNEHSQTFLLIFQQDNRQLRLQEHMIGMQHQFANIDLKINSSVRFDA